MAQATTGDGADRPLRSLAALAVLAGVVLMAAGVAGAQDPDDPYGGTTTTTRPQAPNPTCSLRTTAAAPGATATVTIRAALRGDLIQLRFAGEPVASAVASGGGQSDYVNFDMSFTVPDVEPGTYEVAAVGVDFSARCASGNGAEFEVLADSGGGGPGQGKGKGNPNGGGRSQGQGLERAATYAGLPLAALIALLVVARMALRGPRRLRHAGRQRSK